MSQRVHACKAALTRPIVGFTGVSRPYDTQGATRVVAGHRDRYWGPRGTARVNVYQLITGGRDVQVGGP